MKEMHESNRRHWVKSSEWWEGLREEDGLRRRLPREPELGFEGGALEMIRIVADELSGKDVCVVGSGDNYAAFALCGMERMLHRQTFLLGNWRWLPTRQSNWDCPLLSCSLMRPT